jgi:uncharacterized protein (TIGR02246 family)
MARADGPAHTGLKEGLHALETFTKLARIPLRTDPRSVVSSPIDRRSHVRISGGAALIFGLCIATTPVAAQVDSTTDADLSNPDVAAIVQIAKDYEAAWRAGDADKITSFYSSDAVYIPQGGPTKLTDSTFRTKRREFYATYRTHIELHLREVKVLGDMAYDRTDFTMTMTPKKGGKPMVMRGRLMEILRKENGEWKSFRIMTNDQPV